MQLVVKYHTEWINTSDLLTVELRSDGHENDVTFVLSSARHGRDRWRVTWVKPITDKRLPEALPELLSFADLLIGQIGPGPARRQVRSALCQRQPPTATRSPEESYPEISTFPPPILPTHSLSFTLTHRVPVLVYHS